MGHLLAHFMFVYTSHLFRALQAVQKKSIKTESYRIMKNGTTIGPREV